MKPRDTRTQKILTDCGKGRRRFVAETYYQVDSCGRPLKLLSSHILTEKLPGTWRMGDLMNCTNSKTANDLSSKDPTRKGGNLFTIPEDLRILCGMLNRIISPIKGHFARSNFYPAHVRRKKCLPFIPRIFIFSYSILFVFARSLSTLKAFLYTYLKLLTTPLGCSFLDPLF